MLKSSPLSKAEQKFAATQKKAEQVLQEKEQSQQELKERMARQRALRLAKEQSDIAAVE
jgi:hypothetical protein